MRKKNVKKPEGKTRTVVMVRGDEPLHYRLQVSDQYLAYEIHSQPERTRGKTHWRASNGVKIRSERSPCLAYNEIYVRGVDKSHDKVEETKLYASHEAAVAAAVRYKDALNEWARLGYPLGNEVEDLEHKPEPEQAQEPKAPSWKAVKDMLQARRLKLLLEVTTVTQMIKDIENLEGV
jgi:hypothetical protein